MYFVIMPNLYYGQEATINMEYIKYVSEEYIISPYLSNLCTDHIMWKIWLYIFERGIKMDGRNTKSLRYEDFSVIMSGSSNSLKH